MVNQSVNEGAGPVAVPGMHHQTSGFVDHDEVIIFKEDIEGDLLALGGGVFRFGDMDRDIETFTQLVLCLSYNRAFNADLAFADERLNPVSRQVWRQLNGKPGVQSFSSGRVIGN